MDVGKSVFLPFQNGQEFLDRYVSHGEGGAVLVPKTARISLGDEVDLELAFVEEDVVVHTRGVARFEDPDAVGVQLLESERRTRDILLDIAGGKQVELAPREADRVPARITVEYRTDAVFATDVTDDLSRDGAFIRTDAALGVGERLTLELKPPGLDGGITVQADVVWVQPGERPGIGVKFVEMDSAAQKRVDGLLEQLHRKVAEGRHGVL